MSRARLSRSAATLAQIIGFKFHALGIGISLRDARDWHAINATESVTSFEFGAGKDMERLAYNRRSLARALEDGQTVLGEHAGFSDLFVPVPNLPDHVLVTGPFARARPTSTDILTRWRSLSGRHGHPSDPEFARYLSLTLSTLTLEGELCSRYQRLVECYASLLSGDGDDQRFAEALEHAAQLEAARTIEGTWDAARELVDETRATAWRSPQLTESRAALGVFGFPEHVLVGLVGTQGTIADPVEHLLRLNALQRASVAWAREERALAGRVGHHGVMILVGRQRPRSRTRRTLEHLASRISQHAQRELGLSLHIGASPVTGDAPLGERYLQALAAAEQALSHGRRLVVAEPDTTRSPSLVRKLRAELASSAERQPRTLSVRFERYVAAVQIEAGYRLDLVQAQLEAGFDVAAQALLGGGALGEREHQAMWRDLERASRSAVTVADLVAAYRGAVSDLADLAERPTPAARDKSLRRAVTYVEEHFAQPLTVASVARLAGFAPAYFGQLFRRREGMTLQAYVRGLRVEHAKRLLSSTSLSTARVAELSGFRERHYFYRAFKLVTGVTAQQYRSSATS